MSLYIESWIDLYDSLDDERLEGLLNPLGYTVYVEEVVISTNDVAHVKARQGAPEGLVVLCEAQLSGRGRFSRVWQAVYGKDILMSILVRPQMDAQKLPPLTLLTALAVRQAILEVTGVACEYKWPNDLYIEGRKLCGILIETRGKMDQVDWVVVGIGINTNSTEKDFSEEILDMSTSIKMVTGEDIDRTILIEAIVRHFFLLYRSFDGVLSQKQIEEFSCACQAMGKQVILTSPKESETVTVEKIDELGRLWVRNAQGESYAVISGEVSLREKGRSDVLCF